MSNRVVLVNGNQAAADGAAEFIMGTYVGVGAVLYGVYWLVGYFTPVLLANDLGYLTYLVTPLAIILSAFLLVGVLVCAVSLEDLVTQVAYSCGFSYLIIPLVQDAGWIGYSKPGKIIGFILAFLIGFSILHSLMKHKILLKWTKRLGGVVVFSFLLMPFWDTTSRILKVSGWL